MLNRLTEKCNEMETEFESDEKEIFFGIYASCPQEFKLVRGDRYLILGIADYLREIFEKNGIEEFAKFLEMPKGFKIDKCDTDKFSAGVFYGKSVTVNAITTSAFQRR